MLDPVMNQRMTRVGRGTPMGELMRRYWHPVLLSWELAEPDCTPVRVTLLGESLVAFRDTSGRVGVLDEMCPHRGASLWLGRNEENGLRCVYHGWKYDVTGQCVDMMNEPEEFDFKAKVRARAPGVSEQGGVIWVYLGDPDRRPPEPKFDWTQVPDDHRTVTKVVEECNWLQALEGGIDSSHAQILHRALKAGVSQPGVPPTDPRRRSKPAVLEVDLTDYGYRYFSVRPMLDEDANHIRGYHFVSPYTQLRPTGYGKDRMTSGHHWVPIDDEHCLVWNWSYNYDRPLLPAETTLETGGNSFGKDIDVENGFRAIRNKGNDWLIDRGVQRTETFTGIRGINTQDRAVQETMGPIVDRSNEHLGQSDRAVIAARKVLQDALKTVEDGGDPPGASDTYYRIRAADGLVPSDRDWRPELLAKMLPEGTRAPA
jgi:nitrite reductase/ring-hydroxylating ferredoxin subunit